MPLRYFALLKAKNNAQRGITRKTHLINYFNLFWCLNNWRIEYPLLNGLEMDTSGLKINTIVL